jgi:hypothetical protein
MKKTYLLLSVLLVLLFVGSSYAQTEVPRKLFSPTFLSIIEYRSWKKDTNGAKQAISQISSPTVIKLPLSSNLAFDVAGSYILSSIADSDLKGLTDVRARAVAMMFRDSIMLSAGVNVPNGKSDLNAGETAVSAILSDKSLGFKYNKLGEGLDFNAGGGFAYAFGPVAFGIGAGYIVKGEYTFADEKKYKPGDQLNVTGGFDLNFAPLILRTDATYATYKPDKSEGTEVFKEGIRLSAEESVIVSTDSLGLILSGRYITHGKSEITSIKPDAISVLFGVPSVSTKESKKLFGDQIVADAAMSLNLTKWFSLKLLGESTIIAKNEDDNNNDAVVFGFGGGMTFKSKRGSFFDLTGKYYLGSSNSGDTDLKGYSAMTAIRLIF